MRIPLDWLGEYVQLPAETGGAEVAAALVRVGLEEEGLHGGEVTGPLVVARDIDTAEPKYAAPMVIVDARFEDAEPGKLTAFVQQFL